MISLNGGDLAVNTNAASMCLPVCRKEYEIVAGRFRLRTVNIHEPEFNLNK